MLVDVILFVSWGKHFTLIDIVDLECLQNLSLYEMPDARFGHDWNSDCLLDFLDD